MPVLRVETNFVSNVYDMKTKEVELVLAPPSPQFVGDGFRVHNFIPGVLQLSRERMNPFILLDYNSRYYFSASEKPRGVGAHPHRGFEILTLVYRGKLAHCDCAGNGGVIEEGDVQWMTAASGVLHKEYHEEEFSKKGGDFQMVQLWVNLPAGHKMSKPKYQYIKNQEINKVQLPADAGVIEVIAGRFDGTQGTADTFTPIHLQNARLNAGGKVSFCFPENYHTAALVVEGKIKVNGCHTVPEDHFVLFDNKGEEILIQAIEKSIVLMLSGKPILEPIVAHGPFVMNTREEIREAFNDYNTGKFGYLED